MLPIAYFLLPDKFNGNQRAELLRQAIFKLNGTGAVVTNLVMDNCPVNYSSYRSLGCTFSKKYDNLNTATDLTNIQGKHVLAMFDPPHLIKLIRNALGHWNTIIDWNNQLVNWNHIVQLHNYQIKNGFKLANKLSKKHIEFKKNSMKVKLATQTISRSVAAALLTMKDSNDNNFAKVQPTIDYLLCFDELFDVMNSHSLSNQFSKAPLQPKNEKQWNSLFTRCSSYICNLKTTSGKSVLYSKRSAAFLG